MKQLRVSQQWRFHGGKMSVVWLDKKQKDVDEIGEITYENAELVIKDIASILYRKPLSFFERVWQDIGRFKGWHLY